MSSGNLSISRIAAIDRLVLEISACGTPSIFAQREASHLAAMRSMTHSMSDGELRAVIYDSLFPGA